MSLALTRSAKAATAAALISAHRRHQRKGLLRGKSKGKAHHAQHAHHKARNIAACEAAEAPSCESFGDIMYTFYGNVMDASDEMKEKMSAAEQHCTRALQEFDSEVKAGKLRADALNTELANAAAAKADQTEEEGNKKRYYDATKHEAESVVSACEKTKEEARHTVAAVKKLKAALTSAGTTLPAFEGDCEVSEWIREPCSAACGGGIQTVRREIISMPEGGICPPLNRTEQCSLQPCPVDCLMTPFGEWTLCSRVCGGGTRQRTRAVDKHPQNGGAPCGDILQQEVCNPQPCQQDCALATWSTWSACSKACGGGHLSRVRKVVRPPSGGGACPAGTSADRYEQQSCNMVDCPVTANCKSRIDVVFVVDGSGSAGSEGLASQQAFIQSLATRLGDGAQAAVIVYGSDAAVAAPLGAPSALSGVTLSADHNTTNLAQGLALARNILVSARADAHARILIITDGMPFSKHLAGVEIARAKESADVSFVAVGTGVNPHAIKEWASHPYAEHVVNLGSFEELNDNLVPILGTVCSTLE